VAYTPDLDWVNDGPPGFDAERMTKMQLGIADAHQIGEAAASAAAEATAAAQGAVQSPTVRRIVTSTDPDEPLSEGDLLLVHEPVTQFYTDFTEHPLGAAPDGWSDQWVPFAGATVAEASGASGGRVLELTSASGTNRSFYAWDEMGQQSNVELAGRFRVTAGGAGTGNFVVPGLCVRGSGGPGSEEGYRGFLYRWSQTPRVSLQGYVGAQQAFITHNVIDDYDFMQWQWIRLRVQGQMLMVRAWPDTVTEPSGWQVTQSVPDLASGLVGFGSLNAATVEWDRLGVGINGSAAPLGPIS